MAAEKYFGNTMTLTIETAGDTSSVPIGVLKNVEITLSAEHTELYGADTILREDVKKSQLSIPITAEVASIDIAALHEQWLSGSSTSTDAQATPVDTNDVALFDLTGGITSSGGNDRQAVVEDVYFPELPVWSAEEDTFITWSLEGTGKTIDITDPV